MSEIMMGRVVFGGADNFVPTRLAAIDSRNQRAQPDPVKPASSEKPTNPKDAIGIRKTPMSTVSAAVMAELGVAMLEGALKYGRHNYRAIGVRASVYYDATLRHLFAWWEGEDIDAESELSHITKAIASLVVLRDSMIQGNLTDDRAPRSFEFYKALNERTAALMKQYADKKPTHYTIDFEKSL